jgi:hypothetical protein
LHCQIDCHRPETTLLYQLVKRYYPAYTASLAEQGRYLPKYVEREFEYFLRCRRLEHGFLRVASLDAIFSGATINNALAVRLHNEIGTV